MNLYGTQTRKMKKYWHELSKEEQQKLIEDGLTVKELMKRFKQPGLLVPRVGRYT